MITHSSTFEDLATAPVKQSDVIVARQILTEDGFIDDVPLWASDDDLMEVRIDSLGEMLGTVTKKATVKLLGIDSNVQPRDLFQVRLGIYDAAEEAFEYISQGFFLVDTIDYDYEKGSTTINMYDHMWTAGKLLYSENVTSTEIEYPITIEGMAAYMASLLNVDLMADFDLLPNADYEILEELYEDIAGTTIQNVIQDIAGATGTTARITDTTLVFSQYEVADENLTSDELKTLKIGDTYGPVTSVVLGRVPQNDNIAIYAVTPQETLVESVNATSNLITITDHAMIDGNMIRFVSTGTLPAPLVANTNYYVFTDEEADTFALAPTYLDAIAGTNLINLTTTGSGDITVVPVVTKEIQINNNQILDDDRQDLLPPLYNTLSGIDWSDVKADTVGLGWHEVGDVIEFTQGAVTVKAFLHEVHLVLAGSIKENLVSNVPAVAAINYAAAGGVLKTLYNTEIKVDKQNQQIISLVSQQTEFEGQMLEDFTQLVQDVDDVTLTIQKAGGGNLLLNSVGFAKEQALDVNDVSYSKLTSWDIDGAVGATYSDYDTALHGLVTSYDSSESQNYGGTSGRVIQITSADFSASPVKKVRLKQRIRVAVNTPLSFGVRVRNAVGKGDATIKLSNDNDTFTITVDDTNNYLWEELTLPDFVTTMPWLDVTIESNGEAFRFTDLRVLYGSTLQGWSQSNGEILSANVQFTKDGMRIFDDVHDTETRVTYNEFSTVRRTDGTVLFEADDSGVVTNDLKIKGDTSFVADEEIVIKQITVPNSSARAGLAFVKGSA